MPVAEQRATRSACTPGSRRSSASQPSPDVPRPNRPGEVADDRHAHVGLPAPRRPPRRSRTGRRPAPRSPARGRPRRPAARPAGPRARVGTSMPSPRLGVARQHVVGEGVAAHERARVVGARPDHGDPATAGRPSPSSGRAVPASSRTTDRSASSPGQRPVGRRVEVDVGRARPPSLRASSPRRAGRARAFWRQHPPGGPVDELLGHLAAAHRARPAGAEADGVGQLDVDAGRERQRAGLAGVRGDAVHGREERHRPVVGDDGAGEPPLVAQQLGEQPGSAAGGHAVDLGVGVHHRAGAAQRERHLERRQDDVQQLAAAHRHGAVVAAAREAEYPAKCLSVAMTPALCRPRTYAGAERADQVRVLADGLLDAAPAVVADHVQHRGEPLVHADARPCPGRSPRPSRSTSSGSKVAPQASGRVDGRAPGGEPGQALLVDERRDAEPAGAHTIRCCRTSSARALGRRHRGAAVDPGQLAEAVPARLLQRRAPAGEHVLHRRDVGSRLSPVRGR